MRTNQKLIILAAAAAIEVPLGLLGTAASKGVGV